MRKVNARQFLEQSKHAAEWQRKTLDAARAAGHDVFQDCVIDYAAVELSNIIAAESMYRQDVEASARACVEEGGGIWVGIQEEEGMLYDLVLFNSLKTGSTLALKTTEITPEKVRRQIKNSNEKFRRALTK